MSAVFAFLLAKLFDPIGAAIGLFFGWAGVNLYSVMWGAIVATLVSEIILFTAQETRELDPLIILISLVIYYGWSLLGYFGLKRAFPRGMEQ